MRSNAKTLLMAFFLSLAGSQIIAARAVVVNSETSKQSQKLLLLAENDVAIEQRRQRREDRLRSLQRKQMQIRTERPGKKPWLSPDRQRADRTNRELRVRREALGVPDTAPSFRADTYRKLGTGSNPSSVPIFRPGG